MRLDGSYVVCIGGGFVGQLIQLAVPTARLLDWRKTPPRNHLDTRMGPQYLWEPIPGVHSFSFAVTTLVDDEPPTPEGILAYKRKIGKEHDGGDWGLQFQHKSTGWHSQLPKPRVEYNRMVREVDIAAHRLTLADQTVIDYDVLVNTIPLNAFLNLCTIPPRVYTVWHADPIYMVRDKQTSEVEGMVLNYLTNPDQLYYRETQVEDEVYYESLKPIPEATKLVPGKLHHHPESETVLKALARNGVHCFGRYATWRPDELAHETWKEIDAWVRS